MSEPQPITPEKIDAALAPFVAEVQRQAAAVRVFADLYYERVIRPAAAAFDRIAEALQAHKLQ